jgi:hypothetical protein
MKMSLCKLIANDIVNYGMDQTSNFNYIVYLDSYIDDFEEESKEYINNHIKEICDDICNNENISDFNYDKKNNTFDMVFFWDNLMDANDRYVFDVLKEMKEEDKFELVDIKEISGDILSDDSLKNLTKEKIINHRNMEYEL